MAQHRITESQEAVLWQKFKTVGDLAARARLIESYLDFARTLAGHCYAQRFRDGVAFEDYLQFGSVGLIEAVDRYMPEDGRATFKTYAAHRIRGAILNGLGSTTEVNAQIEARQRARQDRLASLARKDPSEAPGADAFTRLSNAAIGLAIGLLLDDARVLRDGDTPVEDNCYSQARLRRLHAKLASLLTQLPTRERQLLSDHYFSERSFDDIGTAMRLSKGRISQLHKKALAALRTRLGRSRLADWAD